MKKLPKRWRSMKFVFSWNQLSNWSTSQCIVCIHVSKSGDSKPCHNCMHTSRDNCPWNSNFELNIKNLLSEFPNQDVAELEAEIVYLKNQLSFYKRVWWKKRPPNDN